MRPGEELLPLRDLSFWEHHLPWPFLTVPQNAPEINSEHHLVVGRERASACLKGADNIFVPGDGGSGIAVTDAGSKLWFGPDGNSNRNTGPRRPAKKGGMHNAVAIESESSTG
jgi:hypothetical protein